MNLKKRKLKQYLSHLFSEMGGPRTFFVTFLLSTLAFILPYVLTLFLSRSFAPKEYGEISAVLSVSGFVATIILLGSDQACLKFIPEYFAEKNYSKLNGLSKYYFYFVVLLCFLLLISFFVMNFLIGKFYAGASWLDLDITGKYLWIAPLVALLSFFMMVLCAIKKAVAAVFSYYVLPPVFLIVGLEIWRRIFGVLTIDIALIMYSIIVVISVIYQILRIFHTIDPKVFRTPPEENKKLWFITGMQLLFVLFLDWGEGLVNLFFSLTHQDYGDSVAIFNAISTLADLMWISYLACKSLLDSSIAPGVHHLGKLQLLVNKGNLIMFFLGALFFIVFVLFGKTLLGYFGEVYVGGYPALLLLSGGNLLALAAGLSTDLMEYAINPQKLMIINFFGFFIICIAGFLLTSFFGLYGGVLTIVLLQGGSTLVYALIIRKTIGVRAFSVC